jgi:putative DNA primase/helicase
MRVTMTAQVDKPTLFPIPDELRELRRWVTWNYAKRGEKVTKPPHQRINDPAAWLTFDEAMQRWEEHCDVSGVGFVLGEGFVGIDFDDVIDNDGTIHAAVVETIGALQTYAELSPSQRGVHLLIRGSIACSRKLGATDDLPAREIYGGARYFTMTGKQCSAVKTIASGEQTQTVLDGIYERLFSGRRDPDAGDPHERRIAGATTEMTDEKILDRLRTARNGEKAWRLYRGDISKYSSHSEADYAFVRMVRFYTRDAQQIDRIYRTSGLYREKWDDVHGSQTYGSLTIERAIGKGGPVFRVDANAELGRKAHERTAWGKMPAWWFVALRGKGESPINVLGMIASYADAKTGGGAFPSQERIAAHLGYDVTRVKRALRTLRGLNIIKTKTRNGSGSNEYTLTYEPNKSMTGGIR